MELLTKCVRGQVTRLSTCVSVVVVCVFLQGVVYVLPISCLVIHQVSGNTLFQYLIYRGASTDSSAHL